MLFLAWCLPVFLGAVVLTGVLRRYARGHDLFDVPNARSSHTIPTPRGGGFAIVIVVLAAFAALWWTERFHAQTLFILLFGGGGIALLGFWDDHKNLPVLWRGLVQGIIAILTVASIDVMPGLQVGEHTYYLGWPALLLAILVVVWLVNLYNFMDGIDGIASVEAISIAVGAALLIADPDTQLLISLVACAAAGFLVWNWPPAKIFMGDAGSGFLGYVFAVFALSTASMGLMSLWVWLILGGVFFVDSTFTVIRRMSRGDRWYEAHCSHAYQRLAKKWGSHQSVTLLVAAINTFWLLPWAWWCHHNPNLGWLACLIALFPLVTGVILSGAGLEERTDGLDNSFPA